MSGTSRPSALSARLRERLARDRREIEGLTSSELRKLGARLSGVASDELGRIGSDTERQAARVLERLRGCWSGIEEEAGALRGHLRRAWLRPLAVGLSLSLGISIGSWGAMRWLSGEIESKLRRLGELDAEIALREETAERLEGRTWGVYLHEGSEGRYVVLPRGAEPDTGWTIGGRPSVKFSSK